MSLAAGLILGLLGAVVIFGWFTGSATVIQTFPAFAPMQFNTALCFLLIGIGVLLLHRAPRQQAALSGCLAALIGLLTLVQYATGTDLGIDNLVVSPEVTTKTTHPGRMAPNTALCFMLSGIGIALIHLRAASPGIEFAVKCLAAMSFSLAVVALIGYVARVENAYGWADHTRMAVHTAIGFMVASVGLYFGQLRPVGTPAPRSLLSDAPVLLGGVVLIATLWQALAAFENQEVARANRGNVANFSARIEDRMKDRVLALQRLAARQSNRDVDSIEPWRRDALSYVQDFPALDRIALFDRSLKVRASARSVVPAGAPLSAWLGRKTSIVPPGTPRPVITRTYLTRDGRRAFLVLVPELHDGKLGGYVAAVFLVGRLLAGEVAQLRRLGTEVSIHEAGILIHGSPAPQVIDGAAAKSRLNIGVAPWGISAWANASLIASHRSLLPEGVLLAGLMLLALLACLLYYARQANARTVQTEAALDRARTESARRAEAQASIERLNDELKKTVDELAARERDLEEAQSIAEMGSWVRDMRTNEIEWSDYLYQLFGRDPDFFTPNYEDWIDAIHPDDRPAITENLKTAVEHDVPYEWEARITTPDGRREVIQTLGRVEKAPDGTPLRVIGTAQRITQRKEMEERLRQVNGELEQFASIAAHDLQEPVRKIVSFSELLVRDLGDDLPPNAEKDLDFIVGAAKRMRGLVQDLLMLSRTGHAALSRAQLPLRACVDEALEILSSRIEETGATIDVGPLPEVYGDKTLLAQLYLNVIANALKFVPDGCVPHVEIGVRDAGGARVFTVRDNGIGIEPKYAGRIFQPFQRLHGRDSFEGTGIGLAICQKAVERHGGDIWAESADGGGAVFCFTLDARRPGSHHDGA